MQKGKRVGELFIKNERVQGGMGIFALLFFLSLPRNRGGRAARRRRLGPAARGAMAATEWGKRERKARGVDPRPRLGRRRAEAA